MLWKYLSKECSFNVLLNQARPLEENNRRVRDGPYYFFIERETEGGGGWGEEGGLGNFRAAWILLVNISLVRIFLGKGMNIF